MNSENQYELEQHEEILRGKKDRHLYRSLGMLAKLRWTYKRVGAEEQEGWILGGRHRFQECQG